MIKNIKKRFKILIREKLPAFCAKSPKRAFLYYLIFDKSFLREVQAVLAGRVKHVHDSEKAKSNYFLLVRDTHRIEKGLLMRPRRPVFGKGYIKETLDSFEGVWKSSALEGGDNLQLKWFHDVLGEYFRSAGSEDPLIKQLGEKFNKIISEQPLPASICDIKIKSIPYFRLVEDRSQITYEEFHKLCRQRRSVRWFLDKPVPRDLIDKAVLSANQSPSACNRQPFEFRIFDQKELVEQGVSLPMGTKGYGHSIPVFVVLVGSLDAYFDERDRHVIYIDASLAAMSFMLALETLGLGSCAINWPDIEANEKKMAKFLALKTYQRPLMCMGLGYADPEGLVAFSEKRSINQIRKYN
ncbi:nitroreductase family protein [Olivibacter sp. SDN3]|uniref:nitroreductase family protein n=1 Tax=Olivibacter sp. SDN3 TaxID=2764720 RepID=UPI001650E025|nr:nitroreductase family protein [Olivibacter sp. SDN3]QNL51625.1 nitroreductase family protein [Olivibacter sp. SDN3]